MNEPWALLDDGDATAEHPRSRLYTGWLREHRCTDPTTLDAVCAAVQADLADGAHAVLLADYEWGAKLQGAGHRHLPANDASALRVLMFRDLQRLDSAGVARWLARQDTDAPAPLDESLPSPAGVLHLQPELTPQAHRAAIARIHEAIRQGETYQVNHTYRLHGQAWGAPVALYRRLRARQTVGFGALIHLPPMPGSGVDWVLSRSPELFIEHHSGVLTTRPMKGTAARTAAPEADSETARLLHGDTKNRAENLMIVDLLRNDLSRVARLGSVTVPSLFKVEPYATVFQMTSTVQATRRPDASLADLLRALFPCGSITGAPKHHTMDWIADLETSPRGLYTGAIGWLDRLAEGTTPGEAPCPNLCLSVAIRTVLLGTESPASPGLRPLTLGVGGGIVLDSVADDEWEETRWKTRFLSAMDPGVGLFETLRVTPGGIAERTRHHARLAASAQALGFPFDGAAFNALLDSLWATLREGLAADQALRLRIDLRHDGQLSARHGPLTDLLPGPVRLLLAADPLPAARPLSAHKTTLRAAYDAGIAAAERAQAFDSLFFGADGQLVEGGRSNVFVQRGGRWYTPPLADGALAGVMRARVLADPAWSAIERRLTRDDLAQAEALMVCNALRGVLPAVLAQPVSS